MNKDNKIFAMAAVLRPQHWIKNGFVIAPLLFSHKFDDWEMCIRAGLAFAAFCAISSAIYIINDLYDRREDQSHPLKKYRPIASGLVTVPVAITLAVILTLASGAAGWHINNRVATVVLLYFIMNFVYSWKIKHVAILDVMTIAAGFVLRILAGSLAIGILPSHWLVLCTIMISLFLGFTKRRAELVSLKGDTQSYGARIVLKDYSVAFLDQVIAIVTGATIICYALYTVDVRTQEVFQTRAMLLTVPSVMYGIFRYIYIIYHQNKGDDPTQTVMRDLPTLINLMLWVLISLIVVVYGSRMRHLIMGEM